MEKLHSQGFRSVVKLEHFIFTANVIAAGILPKGVGRCSRMQQNTLRTDPKDYQNRNSNGSTQPAPATAGADLFQHVSTHNMASETLARNDDL